MYIIIKLITFIIFSYTSNSNSFASPISATDVDKIVILSYNIRIAHPPSKGWDEIDLPAVAKVINQANPDLVALQEVDVFTKRSGKDVHQAKELARMTNMNYFFAKAVDRSGGDYGVAILSRYPIQEAKGYRLPVSDTTKNEIRALAVIKVQLSSGENIIFCSAHLDHLSDEIRLLQTQKMMVILNKYESFPLIIGADLNMTPENDIMDTIKKQLKIDIKNFPLTFPAVDPKRTIDYILLNDAAYEKYNALEYTTINETYASDHLPLKVVLSKK